MNEKNFYYPAHATEIGNSLESLEYLGIPAQGENLEFPVGGQDKQKPQYEPQYIVLEEWVQPPYDPAA